MDYNERWEIIREIGTGGQGIVFRALDKKKVNVSLDNLRDALSELSNMNTKNRFRGFPLFKKQSLTSQRHNCPKTTRH